MLNYVLISLFAPLVAFMLAGIFAFSKKSNFIGIVRLKHNLTRSGSIGMVTLWK